MGYGMDHHDSIPSRFKIFLFSSVQTGSRIHSGSYPMGSEGFSLRGTVSRA
jgi:hypothetical protein